MAIAMKRNRKIFGLVIMKKLYIHKLFWILRQAPDNCQQQVLEKTIS
jgi:hypothetical protein